MAKILEVSTVAPFTDDSPEYFQPLQSDFSLPLTFCDAFWIKSPPVERLFFYALSETNPTFFFDYVLPKLKHSLRLTLRHFLPVAGNLTWPRDSPKPVVLFRGGENDGVSLAVAESDADFDELAGDHPREAASLHPLLPDLIDSEDGKPVMSLKVTVFPGKGFCIGVANHHAVLDGRSVTMFVKSWAHLCRENPPLPEDLKPFYDRSVVVDPKGLDIWCLKQWSAVSGSSDPKTDPNLLKSMAFSQPQPGLIRTTFVLTRNDIAKLRQKISSATTSLGIRDDDLRLSSFVVAYSYILLCIVKSSEQSGSKVFVGFTADLRSRTKPPVPANYFGNFNGPLLRAEDAREVVAGAGDAALTALAARVGEMVRSSLERTDVLEAAEERLTTIFSVVAGVGGSTPVRLIGVAGSPRFGLYEVDFGWGRPQKVEVVSIDGAAGISMAESRDGNGGIEIGVVLVKDEMEIFTSLFSDGLKTD